MMKVEGLEHTDVIFETIMANYIYLSFATNCKIALTNTFFSRRRVEYRIHTAAPA